MSRRRILGSSLRGVLAVLLLAAAALAIAQQAGQPPARMVFALGYGTNDLPMNNFVAIGTYAFDGGSVAAEFAEFDALANRKPHKASVRHEMRAPYGRGACTNKLIDLPTESARRAVRGVWSAEGDALRLRLGTLAYEWNPEEGVEGSYLLSRVTDGTRELPLAVGFAYVSQGTVPARLTKESFLPWYDGEIYHKDNHAVAETPWKLMPSGLKISAFTGREGGNVLSFAIPGRIAGTWVQNSILLNHGEPAPVFYQDLGHDFNRNGCFDEYGHNKVLLGAWDAGGGAPRRIVYVEYSYAADGFPLLSVGRYHSRR